jgi:hypothetical protein
MSGQKPFYFPSPRAIDPRVAKALPGTLLIAYFPFMALAAANSGQPRESTQYVLKLGLMCFPILLQFGGNIYRKSSPRLSAGQLLFESRDMKYLLRFFGLIAFSTTAIHLFFITKLLSMVSLDPSNLGMMTLYLFQVGYWTLLINIWGLFVVWDLRRVNATEVTLPVSLLFLFMTSVLAGPATTLTVSWVWRDLILQKGRQKKTNKCGERTD